MPSSLVLKEFKWPISREVCGQLSTIPTLLVSLKQDKKREM
jgi:hypothetical protein